MNLITLLERESEQIVAEAGIALTRSDLAHYREAGPAVSHERLAELYRLTAAAIRDRNLAPLLDHMTQVAGERFHAGYAIREVQIAINVLEEAIWNHVVEGVPLEELADALGLVSTALGAAKDALARTYVSLAGASTDLSPDLASLFAGYTGG